MKSPVGFAAGLRAAMLSFGLASSAGAQGFGEWAFRAEVSVPRGRIVALPLPPAVLDACESGVLADLRLIDPRGFEVPYGIIRERASRKEIDIEGNVLDRESPSPDLSRVTIDFGERSVKNSLTVVSSGDNFRRSARVEGSADQSSWADILPQGWVFAVPPDKRFETLEIGPSSHRFLRVSVSRMPDEPAAPVIESVRSRRILVVRPAESEIEPLLESLSSSADTRRTEMKLDFRHRHLPIDRLRLTLASDPQRAFRRPCVILGRDSLTQVTRVRFETNEYGAERVIDTPWERIGAGSIFRDVDGTESLEIPLHASSRYVQVVVDNGDSPALDFGGPVGVVSGVFAVFEPAGQSRLSLFCGRKEASPPLYESAAALAAVSLPELPRASVGPLAAQAGSASRAAPPGQTAVWILMSASVAATLALLWRAAARARRSPAPA